MRERGRPGRWPRPILSGIAFLDQGGFVAPLGAAQAALVGCAALGAMGVSEMLLKIIDYIHGIDTTATEGAC